jgi:hypothetical protein
MLEIVRVTNNTGDTLTLTGAQCRVCGQTRTEIAEAIMRANSLVQASLDEVEQALLCSDWFGRGRVRIALIHDGKNEGFVGGMA